MNGSKKKIIIKLLEFIVVSMILYYTNSCTNQDVDSGLSLSLLTPENHASGLDTSIYFSWKGSERDDALFYSITVYLSDSVVASFDEITEQHIRVSDLRYLTYYRWEVTATNGEQSITRSFHFTTKQKDVVFSTYTGYWKTMAYSGSEDSSELLLDLKSDSTFTYNQRGIPEGDTVRSFSGTWSVFTSGNVLVFNVQEDSRTSSYYFSFNGQDNEYMLLQHEDGLDIFYSVIGTTWKFTRQPE